MPSQLLAGHSLHPADNSGYSVGLLQVDLGQRNDEVAPLIAAYQTWARNGHAIPLSSQAEHQAITDLKRNGNEIRAQHGKPLNHDTHLKLDSFLKSDSGQQYINNGAITHIDKLTYQAQAIHNSPALQHATVEDRMIFESAVMKVYNQNPAVAHHLIQDINHGHVQTISQLDSWVQQQPHYFHDAYANTKTGVYHLIEIMQDPKLAPLKEVITNTPLESLSGSLTGNYLANKFIHRTGFADYRNDPDKAIEAGNLEFQKRALGVHPDPQHGPDAGRILHSENQITAVVTDFSTLSKYQGWDKTTQDSFTTFGLKTNTSALDVEQILTRDKKQFESDVPDYLKPLYKQVDTQIGKSLTVLSEAEKHNLITHVAQQAYDLRANKIDYLILNPEKGLILGQCDEFKDIRLKVEDAIKPVTEPVQPVEPQQKPSSPAHAAPVRNM